MTAREKLLKRKSRKIEIDGDEFFVRSMTLREVLWLQEQKIAGKEEDFETVAFIVANCLTDEQGAPLFAGKDDDAIRDIPTDRLQEITQKVGKLSRSGSQAAALKNSEATPTSSS